MAYFCVGPTCFMANPYLRLADKMKEENELLIQSNHTEIVQSTVSCPTKQKAAAIID